MKKLFFTFLPLFAALSLAGATQYEFNTGVRGWRNGSLDILEDLSSLTLRSDFGSIGNSGSVGYYVYTENPRDAVVGATVFSKKDGAITLTDLRAGDKVGFFLLRKNGAVLNHFYFVPRGDSYFLAFAKGNGWDEHMFFSSIVPEGAPTPSGQPLPGILATLLAGAVVLLIRRARRTPVRDTICC